MEDKLTLNDTIEWMTSDNFKDRLVAEYVQLKIRINKLQNYLYDIGDDAYIIKDEIFIRQLGSMLEYEDALLHRINNAGIDLNIYTYAINPEKWGVI